MVNRTAVFVGILGISAVILYGFFFTNVLAEKSTYECRGQCMSFLEDSNFEEQLKTSRCPQDLKKLDGVFLQSDQVCAACCV